MQSYLDEFLSKAVDKLCLFLLKSGAKASSSLLCKACTKKVYPPPNGRNKTLVRLKSSFETSSQENIVQHLLTYKADIHNTLEAAIETRNVRIISLLLEAKADPMMALTKTQSWHDLETIKELIMQYINE